MLPIKENNNFENIFRNAADKYSVKSKECNFKNIQSRLSTQINKTKKPYTWQIRLGWLLFIFLFALALVYFFKIVYHLIF